MSSAKQIAIVGAGPAGLMAAETAARAGATVTIYDRMPSVARKFLMAGRGGLNLTHSEPLEPFLLRYGEAAERLRPMIEAFPPAALRAWAEELGEATFVGSSGRVFPKSFKASPLLRAWLRRLASQGVEVKLRHRFLGFDGPELRFEAQGVESRTTPDATILACGGASWPRLGSDGGWVETLRAAGTALTPLSPANVGVEIPWSAHLRERFAGQPVKPLAVRLDETVLRGEAVVTRHGLEGGVIYALSRQIRQSLAEGSATLHLDLRPDVSLESLTARLAAPRGRQSSASHLRKAGGLSPVATALVRELGPLPAEASGLAQRIKALPLAVQSLGSLDRAISTAGGLAWSEVDPGLGLKGWPSVFAAGEMLDWEAPTGGYLLQACFATGRWAGQNAAS